MPSVGLAQDAPTRYHEGWNIRYAIGKASNTSDEAGVFPLRIESPSRGGRSIVASVYICVYTIYMYVCVYICKVIYIYMCVRLYNLPQVNVQCNYVRSKNILVKQQIHFMYSAASGSNVLNLISIFIFI